VLRVRDVDHIVVNVTDVERSLAFYCDVLGLEPVRVDEWRRGEAFFPSARVSPSMIIDLLATERSGHNVDHFCLVIEPTDLDELVQSGLLDVASGPVERFGARGIGQSIYVRDPDGNVVELRHYGDSDGAAVSG
jgi:catechol 2,3-dioxygenase-like lactoylglutathione lyase family enzyme